ncbi:MBL fold metallo-hydrolase [Caballeronia sordidicola]|uniref:Low molecular weight protein tyrosine phosphatase n=1 Tax=Caballeronia sordidicola TaxID=196367 RepID=A0A242MKY2_CABSO|nr:MBL fold metallo-hydrolase [Caballeronia sordidicola]OTP71967.1 Low molecular weight protein tyrosine phosphatase [Caballeronia sordidicola]
MSAGDVSLLTETFATSLRDRLADHDAAPREGEAVLYWLGQAGFVIESGGYRMLIDPYLSDSLAEKYKGTKFPHTRLMAAPVLPGELDRLDLVLCTHRHTDHMDPGTLQPLARRFPNLRFVVPAAVTEEAITRCGVGIERLIPVNAGERIEVLPGCFVSPVPSAHESLDRDADGRYPWLGYVIDAGPIRLYHSGDCIPYAGLAETLARFEPHVALLPVNGRDAERSVNGVPGNFTLDEGIALAKQSGARALIAHHCGLFDFNTLPADVIDARIRLEASRDFTMFRAQTGCAWRCGMLQSRHAGS